MFVLKGFHEGFAHYYSSKFLKGGPQNGYAPLIIKQPFCSLSLSPLEITKELEERLTLIKFQEANGDSVINRYNREKFQRAFKPILVAEKEIKWITGGEKWCSFPCSGEAE